MKVWLVAFRSDPKPPADETFAKVVAASSLAAIAYARKNLGPMVPWRIAIAYPWPRGAKGIEQAVARVASIG